MYRIKIFFIGKIKERWLQEALAEYQKRLQSTMKVTFVPTKDDDSLTRLANKEKTIICLDPMGSMMSSEEFASSLFQKLEDNGCRLSFVIGGPEGLPESLKKRYPSISLSPLTYTHQITHLILIEQLYRATEIIKASPYHK